MEYVAKLGCCTHALHERFDIVGFDPRGVGDSEPAFTCGESGEQLELLAAIEMPVDSPDDIAAGEAAANLCIQSMGPVGGLLHSEYVARDMDEIRKALGVEQISYLGFSYGSALGVWYATLFPQSVRAMVVDGADNPIDPASTRQERIEETVEEVAPFAKLLDQALAACTDPECPIYNQGDPVAYFRQAVTKLDLVNQAASDNPRAGAMGVITTLYSQDFWPLLWQGAVRPSRGRRSGAPAGVRLAATGRGPRCRELHRARQLSRQPGLVPGARPRHPSVRCRGC